jgi:hypothetical protein
MSVQTKSWDQVGKKLEALSTHVRRRFDEASEGAADDRAAFEKAVHVLFVALDETVETASRIVRDPILHKDLGALTVALREAIQTTLESVGERRPGKSPRAVATAPAKAGKDPSTKPVTHRTTTKVKATTTSRKPATKKQP